MEAGHPPEDDPIAHAEGFAADMLALGYALDFSLQSLKTEVDRMLSSELLDDYLLVVAAACISHDDPTRGTPVHALALQRYQVYMQRETGLAAYLGETLRRNLGGEWQGNFSKDSPGVNFYLSGLAFGNQRYNPSHYFAYRLSNGLAETGSLASHLPEILENLQA